MYQITFMRGALRNWSFGTPKRAKNRIKDLIYRERWSVSLPMYEQSEVFERVGWSGPIRVSGVALVRGRMLQAGLCYPCGLVWFDGPWSKCCELIWAFACSCAYGCSVYWLTIAQGLMVEDL